MNQKILKPKRKKKPTKWKNAQIPLEYFYFIASHHFQKQLENI